MAPRTFLARAALATLLPVSVLAPTAAGAESFPAGPGGNVAARYYNASQADMRWATMTMYGDGDTRIGRCGCQLSSYTGMIWRHFEAVPHAGGTPAGAPQPHFPTEVGEFEWVIDGPFGWRHRHLVLTSFQSIFSPHYLDQYFRRPQPARNLPENWGYAVKDDPARDDDLGCGPPVQPWALERVAQPVVLPVPNAGGGVDTIELGTVGIAVDMYDGLNTEVIDRNLARGVPTIVGRRWMNRDGSYGGHFQVITGYSEFHQRYRYTDPAWVTGAGSQTINDPKAYQKWLNEVVVTVDTRPVYGTHSHLVLEDDPSPIELSAVLPDGQLVGFDPATGERVTTPGNYMYELFHTSPADGSTAPDVDPVRGLMTTDNPVGVTRTRIIGTGTGPYEVDIYDIGEDGVRTDLGRVEGTIVEGQEIKHEVTYAEDGTITAVEVTNFTPEPVVAPVAAVAGTPAVLDASGSFDTDGTVVAYAWDFGDGATGAGARPTHTWEVPGTYAATVTVTDDAGASRSETVTVEVAPWETAAPTVALAVDPPTAGGGWTNADAVTVTATADDAGGSGVADLTLQASGADPRPPATTPGAAAAVTLAAEGRTAVAATARDRMGNVDGGTLVEVGIDRTGPTATVGAPSSTAAVSRLAFVAGTAGDALSGVRSVEVAIHRADGRTWDGTGWVEGTSWLPADGEQGWYLTEALPEGEDLPPGRYEVQARATDVAGNTGTPSAPVAVTVDPDHGGLPVTELATTADRPATDGHDVGDDGQAVGTARALGLVDDLAVRFDGAGSPSVLALPGGRVGAHARAANAAGTVAGWSTDAFGRPLATTWTDGSPTTYAPVAGSSSQILDIADSGVAVGSSTTAAGTARQRAARFVDGMAVLIDDLDGSTSEATAVNEAGTIVGWSDLPGPGDDERAFLLPAGGSALELPMPSRPHDPDLHLTSVAHDVNEAGVVVGTASGRAVRWDGSGAVTDLGDGQALAVADDGTTVGVRHDDDGTARALLWAAGTTAAVDLNDLVDAGSGWFLEEARGISDDGRYVTGTGRHDGRTRGFVLDLGGDGDGDGDRTAPATTAVAAPGWQPGPVTIELTATDGDGSGIAAIATSLGTIAGDRGTLAVDAEGETTVVYAAVDRAGNVEPPRTITVRVDRTAPVAAVEAPAGWLASGTEVIVGGSDDPPGSGIAAVAVRVDGGPEQLVAPGPFAVHGDGEHEVTAVAVDRAGNRSEPVSAVVRVDTLGPEIVLHPAATGTVPVGTPVAATAADEGSGVEDLALAVVAGGSRRYVRNGDRLDQAGPALVEARARDAAGNVTVRTVEVTVVDPAPPADAPADGAPTADAGGPYEAVSGDPIRLDGTASFDPEGEALRYEWTLDGIPLATTPTVDLRLDAGTYLLGLTVHDARQSSATALTWITVAARPAPVRTALAAAPVLLRLQGLTLYLGTFEARLTDASGAPIPGEPLRFEVLGRTRCTATTGADGVGRCQAQLLDALLAVLVPYTVRYDGDEARLPSSAQARLVR